MFPFLDAIPDSIRPIVDTAAPAFIALLFTLAPYLIIKKLASAPPAANDTDNTTDNPTDEPDDTTERGRAELLAPLCLWFGLTLATLIALLLIAPRNSWSDVWWTNDASLRTVHVFAAGALATLLALIPGALLPRPVAFILRALLAGGVGALGVWLVGAFLVENEIWSQATLTTVIVTAGVVGALVTPLTATPLERTHAPALTLASIALLLGAASAPVFFSVSVVMAHTLGAVGLAFALLALAALRYPAIGRSVVAPGLGLAILLPALLLPAIVSEKMLIATLVPLALAPLALTLHRLPALRALPGPAWLLPGALQTLALCIPLATSTAFATGLLEIHPDKAPWAGEDASSGDAEDEYDDYDWYAE